MIDLNPHDGVPEKWRIFNNKKTFLSIQDVSSRSNYCILCPILYEIMFIMEILILMLSSHEYILQTVIKGIY